MSKKTDTMTPDELAAYHAEKMQKKKAARDKIMATKTDKKGLIIIHTGKGKGKSTAAFGMIFRHIAHRMPCAVVQFIKGGMSTGERDLITKNHTDICQFHTMGEGFTWETQDKSRDTEMATAAWQKAKELIRDEKNSMVLLDEINIALRYDYIDVNEVADFLRTEKTPNDPRHPDRPQRQARTHRNRRPDHRDGTSQTPISGGHQGAGRGGVLEDKIGDAESAPCRILNDQHVPAAEIEHNVCRNVHCKIFGLSSIGKTKAAEINSIQTILKIENNILFIAHREDKHISTRFTLELVIPRTAVKGVPAAAADQHVVVGAAVQVVRTTIAQESVSTGAAKQSIRATATLA